MKNLKFIHSAVHAAVAALCWAVFENLDTVKEHIADHKAYAVPALLAGLALLFRYSDKVAKLVVEKIPYVSRALRRVMVGKDYIEGDWSLVVVDMKERKPLYLGFLSIDYRDGQHFVHGDDWTMDTAHAVSFQSIQSLYRDHALHYWYEQGASLHKPEMRGYTEIFFFPRSRVAQRHAGKFLDSEHTTDIRFYAEKRHYSLFQSRLEQKDEKINAARALWDRLEPDLDALYAQDISADFR